MPLAHVSMTYPGGDEPQHTRRSYDRVDLGIDSALITSWRSRPAYNR
jgi:hypothetical protein